MSVNVRNPDDAHLVTMTNARAANTCTLPGDSGGSLFGGDLGYGVVSAGNFDLVNGQPACNATPRTFYMPLLTLVQRFGATLRVVA
jgi:hypothetical protein